MRVGIKTTLTLLSLIFSLALAAIVILLVVREHEAQYRKNVEVNLRALSDNTSEDLVNLLAVEVDIVELTSLLLRFDPYENIVVAFVFDQNNQLIQPYVGQLGQSDPDIYEALLAEASDMTERSSSLGDIVIENTPIGSYGYSLGRLVVIADVSNVLRASRKSLLKATLPIAIVMTLVVWLLFSWLLGRQFAPVLTLTSFTRKVTENRDYSSVFNVKGNNEVSVLAKSINKMIERISVELDNNLAKTQQLSKQQRAMERLANFDSLTGLPNRQYVMEHLKAELARAKRSKGDVVAMFFDLDGFKSINDSMGHEIGDRVLAGVADRLTGMLRKGDVLARLGGDEFILVPHNVVDDSAYIQVARKIIQAMEDPFLQNGLDLKVGVSIGISRAAQANFELSDLISYADIAMYVSKSAGKGKFTLFHPRMVEGHKRKLDIANSILTAIVENQFYMEYQAKVDGKCKIVGFEALIRWRHPSLGSVSPAEFIPIAEQGGKVPDITLWVIQQVFKDIPTLIKKFGRSTRVSLNLSAIDLKNKKLFDVIGSCSERYAINPKNVEFEVTESAYLDNFNETNHFFQALSERGFSVALDDFGTGFSSLSYLTQIQINTLKIDRQFVQNMEDNPRSMLVTRSIIDLAKRLNLKICAEGIETQSQFETLITEGSDTLQGYLFSKPVPLEQACALPTCIELEPSTISLS
jgi:diguanylate cyclase (GGDEF)-like protein